MFAKTVTGTASGTLTMSIITGINVRETAGAAAVVTLRDGVGGVIYRSFGLAANESFDVEFGENPLVIGEGASAAFYISKDSGTIVYCISGR